MNKNQVLKIIEEEHLQGYNIYEDRHNGENEVVIKKYEDKWSVYVTDERTNKVINSEDLYINEDEALVDFIERLRADKVLRKSVNINVLRL